MNKKSFISALMLSLSLAGGVQAEEGKPVDYPDGYRDWHHVKSMVILPGHPLENPFAGIHHVYANDKALKGLKTGVYDDGAVLVFDLLNAVEGGSAIQEGDRKLIGVMERNAEAYADTGNWGFEGFEGDSTSKRLTTDGGQSCYQCHTSEAKTQYVFSKYRK